MTWTKEIPKEDGFYWIRFPVENVGVVTVSYKWEIIEICYDKRFEGMEGFGLIRMQEEDVYFEDWIKDCDVEFWDQKIEPPTAGDAFRVPK